MVDTNQKVKVSEGQIQALKVAITRAQLTDQEIAKLPDGTNTYKSVGRMYDVVHALSVNVAPIPPPPSHTIILDPTHTFILDLKLSPPPPPPEIQLWHTHNHSS